MELCGRLSTSAPDKLSLEDKEAMIEAMGVGPIKQLKRQ